MLKIKTFTELASCAQSCFNRNNWELCRRAELDSASEGRVCKRKDIYSAGPARNDDEELRRREPSVLAMKPAEAKAYEAEVLQEFHCCQRV
jgi:hypothetical protein